MAWAPTTEQILNLEGVRRRVDSFRFELCDREWTPIGELHPDRDQSVPSIQNDTQQNVKRRLSGLKLLPDEAADVNTLTDRLRVYTTLQNAAEFRLGSFLWGDASRPRRSWGDEGHGELVDLGHVLDQETNQVYGWGRGANILMIMFFLLGRLGFELKELNPFGVEAQRTLPEPKSWDPSATWTTIFGDLGAVVGFVPTPWFDRDGRMSFDQAPDPEVDQPTIPPYGDDTRIIADSIVFSDDLHEAPNEFGVFDSGTDRLRVGRFAVPASAPHSFQNRGFRVAKSENVQGLSSQALADKAARNLARSSDAFEWLTFSSTLDPRHDTYDVLEAFSQRWLETSWAMELRSGGAMTHTMKRVTYDVV